MNTIPLRHRIEENLAAVRKNISDAAARSQRPEQEIQLVAVTKSAQWPAVLTLVDLGQTLLGENRPKQLAQRAEQIRQDRPGIKIQWNLIGQLQRNKVRGVLPSSAMIQSIDSLRLLERVNQIAGTLNLKIPVLLEINVSGEVSKSGFSIPEFVSAISQTDLFPHVQIQGLMTMAPQTDNEALIRKTFAGLRQLRDRYSRRENPLHELSMGMSGDYQLAIEEGATIVRVGSALFAGTDELCHPQ